MSVFLIPFLPFLIFLAACTSRKGAVDADTLQVQLAGEPTSLDPSLVEDGLGFRVLMNLMEGPFGYTNEGELVPKLAEKLDVSKDGKEYRVLLREGAKWSDGVAVEAGQIAFAIRRALDPKTGSKLSSFLRLLDGADEFAKGQAKDVRGLRVEGRTLVLTLKEPVSYFREVLALPVVFPLREDVLARNGGKWDPLRGKDVPTEGAYRLESFERDQRIVLVASRELPPKAPKKVILRLLYDESTASNLFDSGSLDVLMRIPAFDLPKYRQRGVVRSSPFLATYFLSFNLRKWPFNDREFRRAVAGSIRKRELTDALGSGEKPASSWIPEGLDGFAPYAENAQGLDPRFQDSVQRLLKKKYAPADLTFAFDTSGRNSMIMEKVQHDLKENLLWPVKLQNQDWKTFLKNMYSDTPAGFRYGWSSPMRDPILFLTPFVTGDPFSFSKYSNAAYDGWVKRIQALAPGAERSALIAKAQSWLVDEAIVVPIYHYLSTLAIGPRVAVYSTAPIGYTHFEETRLK